MPTLDSIKTRIATVELLRSVVRTMKTLAAVSIRRQEKAIRDLEEYCRTIDLGLTILMKNVADEPAEDTRNPEGPLGIVVLGSDQGLCGRFNEQVVSFAVEQMRALKPDKSARRILCVGRRAINSLAENGEKVDNSLPAPVSVAGILPAVNSILLAIDGWESRLRLAGVVVCHSRIRSGNVCVPTLLRLIPFDPDRLHELANMPWRGPTIPMFTMDRNRLFTLLIRHSLFASLYRALAESMAAENASRLASMQAAEKNIGERLDELNLQFRDLRQGAVTEELLDIVAGFEAMTSGQKR